MGWGEGVAFLGMISDISRNDSGHLLIVNDISWPIRY